MTAASANWSFTQDDFTAITENLSRFLGETKSMCALLVDRSGQLVTTVGEASGLDTTAFATLTAADYSANDQLAKLVGENDFSSLFHQGEKESIYVADVARSSIAYSHAVGAAPRQRSVCSRARMTRSTNCSTGEEDLDSVDDQLRLARDQL